MSAEWKRMSCDLCSRAVAWQHPAGGLRCDRCPRPEIAPNEFASGKERRICPTCGKNVCVDSNGEFGMHIPKQRWQTHGLGSRYCSGSWSSARGAKKKESR